MLDQSAWSHICSACEGAPAPTASACAVRSNAVICFPPYNDSSNSLAMNDHTEVCSLSRPAILHLVSTRLQGGVGFFRVPLPTVPTGFLAVPLPFPAALRAYPVPREFPGSADPSFSPAAYCPRWLIGYEPCHN